MIKNVDLVIPELGMIDEFFSLIDSDRDHLRIFLNFVESSFGVNSQINYFKSCQKIMYLFF
ncbi:hypothetical protein B795N_20830 [Marinilactibacillus psychrotolerans]|nr:hypothetical protein B795N_20830 [Marinilactibacillus psychrotolerans]